MRPPLRRRAKRLYRLLRMTKRLLFSMDLLTIMDSLGALERPPEKHRSTLMLRERRPFPLYIKPTLGDRTFKGRFRMDHADFMVLVEHLRQVLERNAAMGALRNVAVPVEYQVALTLRWLASASYVRGYGRACHRQEHRIPDGVSRYQGHQ